MEKMTKGLESLELFLYEAVSHYFSEKIISTRVPSALE